MTNVILKDVKNDLKIVRALTVFRTVKWNPDKAKQTQTSTNPFVLVYRHDPLVGFTYELTSKKQYLFETNENLANLFKEFHQRQRNK